MGLRFGNEQQEQVFLKNLDTLLHPAPPEPTPAAASKEPPPYLNCINRVWNRKDDSAKRGAVVRAMAFCTRHQCVQVFKVMFNALVAVLTSRSLLASVDLRTGAVL